MKKFDDEEAPVPAGAIAHRRVNDRFVLGVALALTIGSAACGSASRPEAEKPRTVVLISLDTCRADRLGCYGHPSQGTPHIDAVARDGVKFLLAQTTNPITLPAHCSMMTGRIPPNHGVRDNGAYRLDESNVTLAELLREDGYATAAFIGAFPLDSSTGFEQGFDSYDERFTMGSQGQVPSERRAMEVSDSAIAWINEHRDDSFFVFLHYFDAHAPYDPPEPFASLHAGDPYVGEIAYVDRAIGRVVDELKRLGRYESSVIVITADHGESLGEHDETTHGYFVYQSTMRIPLIMKIQGADGGHEVAEAVSVTDIAPTVLAALGLRSSIPFDGVDLTEALSGRNMPVRERPIYGESLVPAIFGCNALHAIVDSNWHYIASKRPEIYDLTNDLAQAQDLIAEQSERAHRMLELLEPLVQAGANQDSGTQEIDPDQLSRLESLGYVGKIAPRSGAGIDPSAVDPKDFIDTYIRLTQAKILLNEGKLADARVLTDAVLAKRPDLAWAHEVAGQIASEEGRLDEASTHFQAILTLLEELRRGEPSEAFELAKAHDQLGRVLARAGDARAGVEHLQRAVTLSPDVAMFHNNLGSTLENLGRLDEAQRQLERAVELRPAYASAQRNLGVVYGKRGDWAAARPHFEAAVRLMPHYVAARYGLAHCLAYLGEFEKARAEFVRVLELAPENAAARQDLVKVDGILRGKR